jgi:hypothetical protein
MVLKLLVVWTVDQRRLLWIAPDFFLPTGKYLSLYLFNVDCMLTATFGSSPI